MDGEEDLEKISASNEETGEGSGTNSGNKSDVVVKIGLVGDAQVLSPFISPLYINLIGGHFLGDICLV